MFDWRTKNVWCLELIPAEPEAVTETVSDIHPWSNRVSFKENMFPCKTKNVRWVKLIPAELGRLFFREALFIWINKNVWYLKSIPACLFQKRKCTKPTKVQEVTSEDEAITPQNQLTKIFNEEEMDVINSSLSPKNKKKVILCQINAFLPCWMLEHSECKYYLQTRSVQEIGC